MKISYCFFSITRFVVNLGKLCFYIFQSFRGASAPGYVTENIIFEISERKQYVVFIQ